MIPPGKHAKICLIMGKRLYAGGYPSKKGREIPRSTKKPVPCEGKGPSPPILTPQLEVLRDARRTCTCRYCQALHTHGAANVYLAAPGFHGVVFLSNISVPLDFCLPRINRTGKRPFSCERILFFPMRAPELLHEYL